MRTSLLLASLLLTAATGCEKTDPLFCKENPGATGCPMPDGDIGDDMGDLDMGPEFDARLCFGSGNGSVCLSQPAGAPIMFVNPTTFDTTAGVSTNPVCLTTQPSDWATNGQPDACFLVATSIAINANLNVTGNRPLVLLASTTITINATLDVAGHVGKTAPGAPSSDCKPFTVTPTASSNGGGGGAGGSFLSQGGPGGDGDNGNSPNGVAGAADGATPAKLRAGCNGQKGGDGQNSGNGGLAGNGGGAVYLIAGDGITLMSGATVTASGGAGARAGRQGGGGGGGSGGMIWLYAPTISASGALVMANGAGGSSGGDDTGATDGGGAAGTDPTNPAVGATGGTGTNGAGNGGTGYYFDGADHDPAGTNMDGAAGRGGGGGGGGKGYIQSNAAITGATTSPDVSIVP
jgi:hypothetical protein